MQETESSDIYIFRHSVNTSLTKSSEVYVRKSPIYEIKRLSREFASKGSNPSLTILPNPVIPREEVKVDKFIDWM